MKIFSLKLFKFIVVGALNTLIHFAILNVLIFAIDMDKAIAGVFAALSAMIFSFAANRQYVFKSKSKRIKRQILVFFAGTAVGALVFNYGTYVIFLRTLEASRSLVITLPPTVFDILQVNVSLVAGSLVALVWNYNYYHRVVFKDGELGKWQPDNSRGNK